MSNSKGLTASVFGGAVLCAVLMGAGSALAQTASPLPATPPTAPGSPQTIPEKKAPDDALPNGRSLSEKLDKSDGVIKPPADVDPAITKQAPVSNTNSMPVIRPPEEKGGAVAK